MNYLKIHAELCKNRKSKLKEFLELKSCGYRFEYHHILPVCLGGSNDKTNLVLLPYEEHVLAHLLLAKYASKQLVGDKKKALLLACNRMLGESKKFNRQRFKLLGIQISKAQSQFMKGKTCMRNIHTDQCELIVINDPNYNSADYVGVTKGFKLPEDAVKQRSDKVRGIPRSKETKDKISKTKTGIPRSEETKLKIKTSVIEYYKHNTRIVTDETKLKLSIALKGKKKNKISVRNRARSISKYSYYVIYPSNLLQIFDIRKDLEDEFEGFPNFPVGDNVQTTITRGRWKDFTFGRRIIVR